MTLALQMLARIALSLLVAALLLAPLFVWGGLDLRELAATWSKLSWPVYLAALGLHVFLYVLRAARLWILIPPAERPRFLPLVPVTAAYSMAAFVLPAKIGEATFVLYSNQVCGVPSSTGIAALVVSRLLDLATLCAGFSLACFALHATHAFPAIAWFQPAGIGLALIAGALFLLSARGDMAVRFAVDACTLLHVHRLPLGRRAIGKAAEISAALRVAGDERRLVSAILLSIPYWLAVFGFCAVLARGLGLPPETTFAQATFGASLAILTSQIPVSAFASFGTLEAGWILGFGVLGVSRELAAATGLGLHVVQLVNVIALGLLGHLAMGALKKR